VVGPRVPGHVGLVDVSVDEHPVLVRVVRCVLREGLGVVVRDQHNEVVVTAFSEVCLRGLVVRLLGLLNLVNLDVVLFLCGFEPLDRQVVERVVVESGRTGDDRDVRRC